MNTPQITYEVCPNCKAKLTDEEIKAQECWNCKWPDNAPEEWDTDDDEAMPNVKRYF